MSARKSIAVARNSRSRIFVTVLNLCTLVDSGQWTILLFCCCCCLILSSQAPRTPPPPPPPPPPGFASSSAPQSISSALLRLAAGWRYPSPRRVADGVYRTAAAAAAAKSAKAAVAKSAAHQQQHRSPVALLCNGVQLGPRGVVQRWCCAAV